MLDFIPCVELNTLLSTLTELDHIWTSCEQIAAADLRGVSFRNPAHYLTSLEHAKREANYQLNYLYAMGIVEIDEKFNPPLYIITSSWREAALGITYKTPQKDNDRMKKCKHIPPQKPTRDADK